MKEIPTPSTKVFASLPPTTIGAIVTINSLTRPNFKTDQLISPPPSTSTFLKPNFSKCWNRFMIFTFLPPMTNTLAPFFSISLIFCKEASRVTTTNVGIFFDDLIILESSGILAFESMIILARFFTVLAYLTFNMGSSFKTVDIPITIQSTVDLNLWTRIQSILEEIDESFFLVVILPSIDIAALRITYNQIHLRL